MGSARNTFYSPYTCTSHGSCLLSYGPLRANPLVCSFVASPTPSHSLSSYFLYSFLCLYGLSPSHKVTTINNNHSYSWILSRTVLYILLFQLFSRFYLMGLETGVGFLFVAFFCSYVFMPPAGLNVRLQIKGTDIRNTTSEDPLPS